MSLQIKIMKQQATLVLSRQQAAAMLSDQQEQEAPSGAFSSEPFWGWSYFTIVLLTLSSDSCGFPKICSTPH